MSRPVDALEVMAYRRTMYLRALRRGDALADIAYRVYLNARNDACEPVDLPLDRRSVQRPTISAEPISAEAAAHFNRSYVAAEFNRAFDSIFGIRRTA